MSQILVNSVRSRHTVIFWWGICSYTQLKVTYEVRKMLCPLCQHELQDGVYSGSKIFAGHRSARESVRGCWMPLVENGVTVWSVVSDEVKPWKSGIVYVDVESGKVVSRCS